MIANLVSASAMTLVGLLFFFVPKYRLASGWAPLLFGALAWGAAVALKFAWAIPVNPHVYAALVATLGDGLGLPLVWIYVGLLTGVFECGLIYLAVRFITRFRAYSDREGLAFGFGFGAIEALLLGLAVLVPTLMALLAPESLPEAARAQFAAMTWAIAPAPTLERIATIFVHAFTTWLIFYAVAANRPRFFWAAFVFKSALDTVAAWAQISYGVNTPEHLWTVEALIMLFGLASVWGLVALGRKWAALPGDGHAA